VDACSVKGNFYRNGATVKGKGNEKTIHPRDSSEPVTMFTEYTVRETEDSASQRCPSLSPVLHPISVASRQANGTTRANPSLSMSMERRTSRWRGEVKWMPMNFEKPQNP